jgi:hypothetical protein
MSVPRPPWWLLVVATAFLSYLALFFHAVYWGPALLGVVPDFSGGQMVLRTVFPNAPASRIGLQPGDQIVAVDGHAVRTALDWMTIGANLEVERPLRLEIARAGEMRQATLRLARGSETDWSWRRWILDGLGWSAKLITLGLAFLIALKRRRDPVALLGAWFLAALAIAFYGEPYGLAMTWRHLPFPLSVMLWLPFFSWFAVGPLLFTFFAVFPRRLFRRGWWLALAWVPFFVLMRWIAPFCYRMVYTPEQAVGVPIWVVEVALGAVPAYVLAGLAALIFNYKQLEDLNERRRVRVLLVGAAIGLVGPVLGFVLLYWSSRFTYLLLPLPSEALALVLFLAFPLSFAYAILRHRLFDIRVMIRQGLQYAVARGVLLSVVPGLAAALLIDLLLHAERPLGVILRTRGWVYAGLGALALTAYGLRQRWLEHLDRHFFRERYDAERLLRDVVRQVHEAATFEQAARRVIARIESALHPEFVALLLRDSPLTGYRMPAAAPASLAPLPMAPDSKLMALLRLLGRPLELSLTTSGWLVQQLPHHEVESIRQAHLDLLVPIPTAPGRAEAAIALGVKRSEEPYTSDEQELLSAIAAGLAVLLERPAMGPMATEAFEECPDCGTCCDPGIVRCPHEGTLLALVRLPRLLAGRYRFERRLGRGGMGTVYEATDIALERPVALKVIREELIGSADAAERFHQEARIAATLAHPNVVTIYDFGLATSSTERASIVRGTATTRAFLVMERLVGRTLREELRQAGCLSPARTVDILSGVTAAIDAAHRRQLLHRDLKPENIFLAHVGAIEITKVVDFGLAKFLPVAAESTPRTGTGMLLGTLGYMAPEQLSGAMPTPSWDIWALGVIAYEMVTGMHPFAATNLLQWHSALKAGRWTPIAERAQQASERWQQFFERALAPSVEQRPASVAVFFAELQAALAR